MKGQGAIAVVISTWTGSPASHLLALCRSLDRHPAGLPFDLVLSANGLEYVLPHELVSRFRTVFVRENVGYNLGAWDHAWRRLPEYERFLFLQDDCVILKLNWLDTFNRRFEAAARCGLVGEYIPEKYMKSWEELSDPSSTGFGTWSVHDRVPAIQFTREQLARWGIPAGSSARAVTAVVQYTSRRILELVDGYNLGKTKGEAIAAEIGFSRKIEAQGLTLVQLGRYRHRVIGHPQWPSNHPLARLKRSIYKRLPRSLTS